MKKGINLILAIIIIFTSTVVNGEISMEGKLRSYILADVETGQVLEAYNIGQVVEIASISKLMTYLIVMDNISSGDISLEDKIVIDKDTARIGGSSLKLKEGEIFTVADLLKGALVVSGNDAAYALSKHVAGTEKEFAKLMNKKAREIELDSAIFYNSTGLPVYEINQQNKMTTTDIFKLSQHIIKKYPEVLEISSIRAINMVDRDFYGRNTNPLLMKIQEVDGLKTGYTGAAGWCDVCTFNIEGIENKTKDLRLVSIVMGSKDMNTRDEILRLLVESAIDTYSSRVFLDEEIPIDILETPKGNIGQVKLYPKEGYSKIIRQDEDIKLSLDIDKNIKLPLVKRQKIGIAKIVENGQVSFKTDIIVKEEVNKGKWYTILFRKLVLLFS